MLLALHHRNLRPVAIHRSQTQSAHGGNPPADVVLIMGALGSPLIIMIGTLRLLCIQLWSELIRTVDRANWWQSRRQFSAY